jgi:hypothetical protein
MRNAIKQGEIRHLAQGISVFSIALPTENHQEGARENADYVRTLVIECFKQLQPLNQFVSVKRFSFCRSMTRSSKHPSGTE